MLLSPTLHPAQNAHLQPKLPSQSHCFLPLWICNALILECKHSRCVNDSELWQLLQKAALGSSTAPLNIHQNLLWICSFITPAWPKGGKGGTARLSSLWSKIRSHLLILMSWFPLFICMIIRKMRSNEVYLFIYQRDLNPNTSKQKRHCSILLYYQRGGFSKLQITESSETRSINTFLCLSHRKFMLTNFSHITHVWNFLQHWQLKPISAFKIKVLLATYEITGLMWSGRHLFVFKSFYYLFLFSIWRKVSDSPNTQLYTQNNITIPGKRLNFQLQCPLHFAGLSAIKDPQPQENWAISRIILATDLKGRFNIPNLLSLTLNSSFL